MKYGYFDDVNREYVITTPKTPLPWINYLGSQDFFRLISNTSGGYCFYKDAKLMRLTRYRYNNSPIDCNGHYYYIKDGDTIWNPGWQPVRTELDSYECRHGLGYTVFESSKNGIRASQEVFVPLHDKHRTMLPISREISPSVKSRLKVPKYITRLSIVKDVTILLFSQSTAIFPVLIPAVTNS